jgi:hypothetical protein
MTKVLIIASDPETAALYRSAVEKLGADCEVAASFAEMKQKMRNVPFNGVILDVLTAVRAPHTDKIDIQHISDVYPTLRVRWDAQAREIRGIVIGKLINKENPLGSFLDQFCRTHPARICRINKRHPIHFNVLLSKNETFTEDHTEKTTTLDISKGGCFLISNQGWQDCGVAWVRFLELSDPTPIPVVIRRWRPWGQAMLVPGIGVEYKRISPAQLEEISRHFKSPEEPVSSS